LAVVVAAVELASIEATRAAGWTMIVRGDVEVRPDWSVTTY